MMDNDYKFKYPEYQEELDEHRQQHMYQQKLTGEEKIHYITGAVAAGLVIAGVFIVVIFLFLLFCTHVWLA